MNAWTHAIVVYELAFPVLVLTFAVLMIVVNVAFLNAEQLRRMFGWLGQRRVATIATGG